MFNENTLDLLKDNKIKITAERKEIVSILQEAQLPLSPAMIYQRVSAILPKTNLTTVYRNLEMLESLGLAKRLIVSRSSFSYELTSDRGHHHHLVCKNCGKVQDLENISEEFVDEISRHIEFKIEDHNLEFFGFCSSCQN